MFAEADHQPGADEFANRQVQDKAVRRRYRARTVQGHERREWWDRAVSVWPDHAAYQTRTDREIPVVVMDPVD